MTIVATTETRNSQWANDPTAFGRKMLSKMGWKGSGLGKNQQGSSTHLRAVKRSESLGIGAESDAFGDKGWQDTNAGFHGVLANLKREYSSGIQEDDEDVDEATKKKRRKDEKKRKKKIEKRRAKQLLKNSESGNSSSGSGSDTNTNKNGIRLPQNKVQAGHARKMREAKDISNKSSADMAAIFGVKADFYKQPKNWIEGDIDNKDTPSDEIGEKKSKKAKSKKSSKSKRKRSSSDEAAESDSGDSRKKKRKKSKSKK